MPAGCLRSPSLSRCLIWARDTDSFAHGWAGKLLVMAVLIGIPTLMLLQSLRLDRYANDS
jgi:hypothetical protein